LRFGRLGETAVAIDLVEPFLDHLERKEVLALLPQDPAQTFDITRIELAVPRRRALRIDEALALEEPDLRNGDLGELLTELIQHVADRHVRARHHESRAPGSRVSFTT